MQDELKSRAGNLASADEAAEGHAHREPEAIALLQEWLSDESGYDERVWPSVKQGMEENRLADRSRFRG